MLNTVLIVTHSCYIRPFTPTLPSSHKYHRNYSTINHLRYMHESKLFYSSPYRVHHHPIPTSSCIHSATLIASNWSGSVSTSHIHKSKSRAEWEEWHWNRKRTAPTKKSTYNWKRDRGKIIAQSGEQETSQQMKKSKSSVPFHGHAVLTLWSTDSTLSSVSMSYYSFQSLQTACFKRFMICCLICSCLLCVYRRCSNVADTK